MPSILAVSLADPLTDRRTQSFKKFFTNHGWSFELLSLERSSAKGPSRFLDYHRKITRAAREHRADVVMACDLFTLGGCATMKRIGNAQRLIYDAREVYTELPTVAQKPLSKTYWKRFERRYIDQSDLMLVTGPLDADAIRRAQSGIPRSVLVRNLPWRAEALRRDRSLIGKYGLHPDTATFVYVGGLQIGRGLATLVDAMVDVPAQLLVIGGGVLENDLRQTIDQRGLSDRVTMTGAMDSTDAMALIASCDAGISLIEPLSKSYELALPSKLFEYMMAGLPVLSSQLIQVEQLFAGEEWIEFVDVNDRTSVVNGLRSLLGKLDRTDLRAREQSLANSTYHFESDVLGLLEILKSYHR